MALIPLVVELEGYDMKEVLFLLIRAICCLEASLFRHSTRFDV